MQGLFDINKPVLQDTTLATGNSGHTVISTNENGFGTIQYLLSRKSCNPVCVEDGWLRVIKNTAEIIFSGNHSKCFLLDPV